MFKLHNGEILRFKNQKNLNPGDRCTLTIRPEKIKLYRTPLSPLSIPGTIKFITYAGDISSFRIDCMQLEVRVQQQNLQNSARFQIGDKVYLDWDFESNLILDYKGDA
ncbi:MAG: TOBE domain-containing protein [Tepidanaerobacteraceae bacterium]|nr:TOBE domain-containing protein [Tepidanaerobacteraceae bacterium]